MSYEADVQNLVERINAIAEDREVTTDLYKILSRAKSLLLEAVRTDKYKPRFPASLEVDVRVIQDYLNMKYTPDFIPAVRSLICGLYALYPGLKAKPAPTAANSEEKDSSTGIGFGESSKVTSEPQASEGAQDLNKPREAVGKLFNIIPHESKLNEDIIHLMRIRDYMNQEGLKFEFRITTK